MTIDRNDAWVSLLELFRASLEENGEHDMAIQVPFVGEVHDYRGETFDNKRIQLFSLIAHLLNMVEIKRSVDERRSLESPDMREVEGLFAHNIKLLLEQGFTEEDIHDVMRLLESFGFHLAELDIRQNSMFHDKAIMRHYACLVKNATLKQRIMDKFENERRRAFQHLAELFGVSEDAPLFQLDSRRQTLLAPLHRKQIDLLSRWREQKNYGYGNKEEEMLLSLLLTINAISGVMGYTG